MPDQQNTLDLLRTAVAALGGTRRANQEQMAEAVAHAFDAERHLAVQAGTGTGKSLAYLVPAIALAMATDEPVVVSTATIALQRQLVDRDLPRLVEAISPALHKEFHRAPQFAILKGRSNYLCLAKAGDVAAEASYESRAESEGSEGWQASEGLGGYGGSDSSPATAIFSAEQLSRTAAQVLRLREWAHETDSGDRDALPFGVSDDAWRQVSVSARECIGATKCPFGQECFAELARAAATEVDIVVTNHAMLAIDALSEVNVLPQHSATVIDEAHELDRRITSVATEELSPTGVIMMAKRAAKLGVQTIANRVEDTAGELQVALAEHPTERWDQIPEDIGALLVRLRNQLWEAQTELNTKVKATESAGADSSTDAEAHTVRAALEHLHDTIVRILDQSDFDVVWLSERRAIHIAPLSVAGLLREGLFEKATTVLTSATLTLGGKFDAIAASWGLPKHTWDGLDVGTPFDAAQSGILYVAKHLPKPGRDGMNEQNLAEMQRLIEAAQGRTLALFSSRRAAEFAADQLRQRVDYPILLQGEDSLGALVDEFAADESSCLFGTLSLWQGVDVPGPSLSLVIIDRIPFPRPDDPLLSARSDAAKRAGRNGFMEVSATHAALLMAQGAGRLLRSTTDRGVVAVLDPRLATARYGAWIAASMPDFWRTTSSKTVQQALRRLVN